MSIEGLEPKELWKHFDKIRSIPRCSGHEEQLAEYLLSYAKGKNLEAKKDSNGNVVIKVPATPGHENAPVVVLQGHMDMVCEKNADVDHDFSKDPIELVLDGDWLKANGTTLGADNGIGLAAALATIDAEDVVHGPLELLFTVDEEVGLTGAGKLEPGFLEGKTLLNLDSEEIGAVYIGCSGGGDSTTRFPVKFVDAPVGTKSYLLKVTGLRGGHSGIDIIEQRGNAIKILGRLLWKASRMQPCHVASINGGNKRNAIPREAVAEVMVLETAVDELSKLIADETQRIAEELGGREKDMDVRIEMAEKPITQVLDEESQKKLLNLILAIPHGVEAMSYDIPGLVETSNNLATISTGAKEVVIGTSTRSSIGSALQALRDRIRAVAELAGAEITEDEPYPGWKPNLESKVLAVVSKVHERELGEKPEMKAIHAGLECGIIGEKFPGMDMVSFGPQIEHPHSPEERVNIPSVEKFWKLLKAVLAELAA
ncbi:MAG: cytosol nonspecific dipeptidase [Candidatus Latescibacteria bacterium 4484_7]|nr:MAG: cytosol nonspecific dipeptidase [Candidatus Latescibacteria bacterium 4484_7]